LTETLHGSIAIGAACLKPQLNALARTVTGVPGECVARLTQKVSAIEIVSVNAHAACGKVASDRLRFPG
jgi:hypothetical protein